jgi:hypothetical protein
MRVRAGSGGWAFLQRSEIGDSTVTSTRELAFQFLNGAHQSLTRALQRIASSSHRDGKCRISEVSWVINPGPILLRRYPGFEFVRGSVEISHNGFHLRDPLAGIVDSWAPRTINFLDSSMVVASAFV